MQHDHVLKKLNFDLLTIPPGSGSEVYWQNICYHVAACVIPFNLIYNMTIFGKSLILASVPPLSPPRGLNLVKNIDIELLRNLNI